MPTFDAHQPGMLCWVELATLDLTAAKQFYERLFGWTSSDTVVPDGSTYTVLRYKDRDVAAATTMQPAQREQGVPPNWLTYVSAASVDETAAKSAALGVNAMAPPFDVMDMGRMAVFQDPTGAVFAVWQPRAHHGIGLANEVGALCWSELWTRDTEKARAYYTGLFGWGTQTMPMPEGMGDYTTFTVGGAYAAGMMPMPPHTDGVPPHWLPYFGVADCDKTVAAAKAAGAKLFVPPTTVPTVGRFATMMDPQGAAVGVLQPAPKA